MLPAVSILINPALVLLFLVVIGADVQAQIKADPAALNLGRQQQEKSVTAEVKLTNVGSAPLEILAVTADCSCTVATPDRHTLPPGESTTLNVMVETRSYQGLVHRNVRVQTSSGELTIPVELTVSLYKSWTLSPAVIVLPPSQKGRETTLPITLQYTGEGKVTLGKISGTPGWLTATATSEEGKTFSITLVKHTEAPAGNHTVKVVVENSDPVESQLTFNVFVPVTSTLRIIPNPAVLPTVKVGQPANREIVIHGWSKESEPRLELARGKIRLLEREGERLHFEITVTPDAPGPFTQLLRIYDGGSLEAEIPVILRAEPSDKAK